MSREPSQEPQPNGEAASAPATVANREATPAPATHGHHPSKGWRVALGALGVVFGDIGTSPLYAFKESFHGVTVTEAHVLGVVSCVFWALVLVVGVKYCAFVLRADNRGEGGMLALMALAARRRQHDGSRRIPRSLIVVALFGTALFFGEGMLTPAISVLGAVEGLGVASDVFDPYVMPIAVAILVILFMMQRRGTGGLGQLFGPVTLVWFVAIAAIATPWIASHPTILRAIDPRWAVGLLTEDASGFFVLGSVVLTITGAEALFADLGHFGKSPIRRAWFAVVFPALFISYAGQGAFMLDRMGTTVENPFWEMVPGALLVPLVILATFATIVAAQALISGVFSVVHQGIQLGFLPRLTVIHTSTVEGQVYIPQINLLLGLASAGLVVLFKTSSNLASAYGIAVTGTMAMTSFLFYHAMVPRWGVLRTGLLAGAFLALDLTLFVANLPKFPSGGWIPIATGLLFLLLMVTWIDGSDAVRRRLAELSVPLSSIKAELKKANTVRIPGTAVFLTRGDHGAPPMLVHHVRHSHALHQNVVLLTVNVEHVPTIAPAERLQIEYRKEGFIRVVATYGFQESPDLRAVLDELEARGVPLDAARADIFIGHSTIVPAGNGSMSRWRVAVFQGLLRNSRPATTFFQLPCDQVEEVGVRLEI
ncbi:MAG: KUP/HAK/KT family potassium transporter [Deltaproteobacteria bacterium]|nr:KUP/HAK/KT family potassium transporter [Deltaproteobacteria bacterium]